MVFCTIYLYLPIKSSCYLHILMLSNIQTARLIDFSPVMIILFTKKMLHRQQKEGDSKWKDKKKDKRKLQ